MTDTQPSLFDPELWAEIVAAHNAETGGSEIADAFQTFDESNPHVYTALVQMARDLVNRGHRRIGMKMLFEVLRWQTAMYTTGSTFKLNNNYTSHYARVIMENEPDLRGVFELRALKDDQ